MIKFTAPIFAYVLFFLLAVNVQANSGNTHAAFIHSKPAYADYELAVNSTGGDCARIGIWDSGTKTCTLQMDLVPSGNIIDNGNTIILSINGTGIVLDGNGHSITGTHREMGVYVAGKQHVTVKNLTVTGCAYGLFLIEKTTNAIIEQNIIGNNYMGISITTDSNNNTISHNSVLDNSFSGIYLGYYADGNKITDNVVLRSGYGIMLYGNASKNTITNNVIDKSVFVGFNSYDNIIEGNTF